MSQIVLCFLHSTSVLSFHIEVVVTLYIGNLVLHEFQDKCVENQLGMQCLPSDNCFSFSGVGLPEDLHVTKHGPDLYCSPLRASGACCQIFISGPKEDRPFVG